MKAQLPYLLLLFITITPSALSQTTMTPNAMNPYSQIELKARQVDPADRKSLHALNHAILTANHVYPIPDAVASSFEDRLTDAEFRFRNKSGHGVSEAQMVDLTNWIVDRMHLPGYMKTTAAQVRTLRMKLTLSSPSLMGNTLTGKEIKRGDHIRTEMSPLQALHLFQVMVDQKILNPDYQDPTIDIVAAEKQRTQEREKAAASQPGRKAFVIARPNPKGLEIRRALNSTISDLSIQDALAIVNHALSTLSND
jgi:hypothetical protein